MRRCVRGGTPSQADDTAFINDVVVPVLGRDDHPKKAILRRVYYEAYTLAAADMKRKVERTEDDAPRKLPAAERASPE